MSKFIFRSLQFWEHFHLSEVPSVCLRIPLALSQYLQDHPGANTLYLHLDNDGVGRDATEGIMEGLGGISTRYRTDRRLWQGRERAASEAAGTDTAKGGMEPGAT